MFRSFLRQFCYTASETMVIPWSQCWLQQRFWVTNRHPTVICTSAILTFSRVMSVWHALGLWAHAVFSNNYRVLGPDSRHDSISSTSAPKILRMSARCGYGSSRISLQSPVQIVRAQLIARWNAISRWFLGCEVFWDPTEGFCGKCSGNTTFGTQLGLKIGVPFNHPILTTYSIVQY